MLVQLSISRHIHAGFSLQKHIDKFVGHDRYAFMTVLCDHEYLCRMREKNKAYSDV